MAANYYNRFTRVYDTHNMGAEISYVELMTDLNYYIELPKEEEDWPENGAEIREANRKIEEVQTFNFSIYTSVTVRDGGMSKYYEMDPTNYIFASVNQYNLQTEIKPYESMAFYNERGISVVFDEDAKLKDKQESDKSAKEGFVDGDYVDVYIVVETITGELESVCYHIVYTKANDTSDGEEDGDTGEENNWPSGDITDPDSDKEFEFNVNVSEPMYEKHCFLNTYSFYEIRKYHNNRLVTRDNFIRLYVDPKCMKTFNMIVITNGVAQEYVYKPARINVNGKGYSRIEKLNSPIASYSLLRTNPKLTGNIKVVIDSKDNIYLDTFKVSKALSQRKYRHIKVGSNDYYGKTVMSKFKSIPPTDLYKIEDKCFNLFTTAQTYSNQYYDLYRAGVKTNDDLMYSENFAMLAPLWIKDILPDFFLVFKVNKTSAINEEEMTDKELITYFLENGVLIKSYDMRYGSNLGTYIRKILEESNKEVGDVFVSYETSNFNKFNGISVQRGVVTSIYESTFKQDYVNNQVALNDFYTGGFERNNLISKNIINFEYMFDDETSRMFSINTYYGLYVRVNKQTEDFCVIGKTVNTTGDITHDSINDIRDRFHFDKEVYALPEGITLSKSADYSRLIYGITTPTEFIRLNTSIVDSSINNNFLMKPYKNIITTKVNKVNDTVCKEFITVKFDKPMQVGDHYRVIDTKNKTIYEVITTNFEKYKEGTMFGLSKITTNYFNEYHNDFVIKRISMYVEERPDDISKYPEFIKKQVESLFYAFKKFEEFDIFNSHTKNDDTLSIISQVEGTVFERICSPSGFEQLQKEYLSTLTDEDDTIKFFDEIKVDKCLLDMDDYKWKYSVEAHLYPFHFELVGNRIAYVMNFASLSSLGLGNVYYGKVENKTDLAGETLCYRAMLDDGSKEGYALYKDITLKYVSSELDETGASTSIMKEKTMSVRYLQCFEDLDTCFLNTEEPIITNSELKLYTIYPINSGICSILQLKDFDFNVLDATSYCRYDPNFTAIGPAGEFAEKSFFNSAVDNPNISQDEEVDPETENTQLPYSTEPIRNTSEENIKDYFDKYRLYMIDKNTGKEYDFSNTNADELSRYEAMNSYLKNLIDNNHTKSSISLISPYCVKWKAVGTDSRGENLRIMYDYESLVNSSSYYISGTYSYYSYLGYLYFRDKNTVTIDETQKIFQKYISKSLNNTSYIYENEKLKSEYFGDFEKNYILKYKGVLDDILYDQEDMNNKFSLAYMSGENTIEFISAGVKIRIKSTNDNAINMTNYSGYSAIFVSLPDMNRDYRTETELLIDETRKQMMFVWYQGVDSFKYGERSYQQDLELTKGTFMTRIFHSSDINDVLCTFVDGRYSLKIPDDISLSTQPYKDYTDDPEKPVSTQGIRLCDKFGVIFLGTMGIDDEVYTKYNRVNITARIKGDLPSLTLNTDSRYGYYCYKNYMTGLEPYLWVNDSHAKASNSSIDGLIGNYDECLEAYIITDNSQFKLKQIGTFTNLKRAAKQCSIFIKKYDGKKDYTKLEDILSVEIVEPLRYYKNKGINHNTSDPNKKEKFLGYVHSTYAEPVMKDMFIFSYNTYEGKTSDAVEKENDVGDVSLEKIFHRSFDGSNIWINGIKYLGQVWINKYTEDTNYCILNSYSLDVNKKDLKYYKLSLDVVYRQSLMKNSWSKNLYRKYYGKEGDEYYEDFINVAGYETGFELKTFFNSRGIVLHGSNGRQANIQSWKYTQIDTVNNYIKLNITDSLIYMILFTGSYTNSWRYLNLSNNYYKIKYINNTVLDHISINNKTKFTLYKSPSNLYGLYFGDISSSTNLNNLSEVKNYKNELKYENGKYYMYVYPEEKTTYYAKMTIDL